MGTTETRETTATKLARIAKLSASDRFKWFDSLMHLFNEESLAACFRALDGKKAVGADGVRKAEYGDHLETNLKELIVRMKRMGYPDRSTRCRRVCASPSGRRESASRKVSSSSSASGANRRRSEDPL